MPHLRRRKTSTGIILIVITLALGIACKQNQANVYMQPPCNLPDTISFKNDVEPIFELSCTQAGCHSGSDSRGRVNLDPDSAYYNLFKGRLIDTLTPAKSELYQRLTSSSSPMPPGIYLDNCSLKAILTWIEQGAKNN